jgi:hypothetical protein
MLSRQLKCQLLKISSARFGFCCAIAVIAAAIADPLVEFASNAGWLGPGSFTDRSNLDVFPALLAGVALLAVFMARKARAVLAGSTIPLGLRDLPLIFVLQIVTLYSMETAEQLITAGHVLGPMTWLGGPLPISLAVHGVFCFAVTLAIVRSRRALAATTLRVIRLITAIATFAARVPLPIPARRFEAVSFKELLSVLCVVGERAPPMAPA